MKRSPKTWNIALSLVAVFAGCKLMTPENLSTESSTGTCSGKVNPWPLPRPMRSCNKQSIESRRFLEAPIPCNTAQLLSHADSPLNTNGDIVEWMKTAQRFRQENVTDLFSNQESFLRSQAPDNPILKRPIAKAIKKMITEAKEVVFYDIFLLGGTWGLDIANDLLSASRRGVKVIVLRDTENTVAVGEEMTHLWSGLESAASKNPNLKILRSYIDQHPSAIPFGANNFLQVLDPLVDLSVSLKGKSDHSKTVITDPFSNTPRMLVGSKNTVDTAGAYFFDEALLLSGPAATNAFLRYFPDLELAEKHSNQGSPQGSWFTQLIEKMGAIRSGKETIAIPAAGVLPATILENNGDDSVRNIENGVISLLAGAKKSIDIYEFLSYNPMVGKALANAIRRGVRVRVLVDALPAKIPMNQTLAQFVSDELRDRSPSQLPFRWRKQIFEKKALSDGRTLEFKQQQHVKTIIVDGETLLVGSANFDSATLAGAFREMSVAVKSTALAAQAVENFSRIYDSNDFSTSLDALQTKQPSWFDQAKTGAFMNTLRIEQARIRAIDPSSVENNCW